MKEAKKLTLGMALLFLIIFVTFGTIIVKEKLSPLIIPKITQRINSYIDTNYKDLLTSININDVEYKELKYQTKVTDKKNQNHYFYIYYENKNITDTYNEDYIKGNSIISYQEKTIKENIYKKTKSKFTITILNTLDKYTEKLRNEILTSTNPESLKIYNLSANISVSSFTNKGIVNSIRAFSSNMNSKNINPKNYSFTFVNPDDETIAVNINNLTEDIINNKDFTLIINDIINKKKSNLLSTYDITYEYLN